MGIIVSLLIYTENTENIQDVCNSKLASELEITLLLSEMQLIGNILRKISCGTSELSLSEIVTQRKCTIENINIRLQI
jgi:hypothetical protein